MSVKLVVNNVKKKKTPFLSGKALIEKLEELPTVQSREELIVANLKKLGL